MLQKTTSNISFSSTIRFTTPSKFEWYSGRICNENSVKSPWTEKQIIKAPTAKTRSIYDCTAGGITDGKDVVMFHICPDSVAPQEFDKVEKTILEKIDLKSPYLQAFLVGSCDFITKSRQIYNCFENLMEKYKIPYSEMKGHFKSDGATNLMYDARKDEWVVTNSELTERQLEGFKNPEIALNRVFKTININKEDELVVEP